MSETKPLSLSGCQSTHPTPNTNHSSEGFGPFITLGWLLESVNFGKSSFMKHLQLLLAVWFIGVGELLALKMPSLCLQFGLAFVR